MFEIVKVQLPIIGDRGVALVYAEGKKDVREQPIDKRVRTETVRNGKKAFFRAQLKDGEWVIGQRVRDRRW